MMNFAKKTGIAALLLLCTAMFLSAWERSFDIPGKGTLEREVEVERVDEYDKNGRLVTSYYAGNIEEYYKYDRKGRLILFSNSNEYEKNYEYDKKGNLIHTKDVEGYEEWFSYDEKGNLLVEKNINNLEKHYFYDEAGNLSKYELHDLEGDAIIEREWYYYDENNRKIHMEPSTGCAIDYTYNADGKLIGERYSDGTRIEYVYSDEGLLLYSITITSDDEYENFYVYEFWGNGKIKQITICGCLSFG